MQIEKPKQPLQNTGKPSLAAYKAAAEREHADLNKMLISAVIAGNEADVKKALDAGAVVDALHPVLYCTPLAFAAEGGHTRICALLIERGANVNAKGFRGQTPLMRAAFGEHIDTCALLMEKGAGPLGMTPSQLAGDHCPKSAGFFTSMRFLKKQFGKKGRQSFISDFRNCISGGA